MRIVAVSLYPGKEEKHVKASGVASYTKNLLKQLPLGPDDELFVIANKLDDQPEQYREDGFTILRVFDRNIRFVGQIFRAIRDIRPDVVHIQQEVPLYGNVLTAYLLQWLVWLLRKYTVVVTLHHVVSLRKIDHAFVRSNKTSAPLWLVRWAFRMIYTPLVNRATRVIVHEPYFKDVLVGEYRVGDAEKIVAVPHGVENFHPLARAVARQGIAIAADRHIVLFMGYLAGYKGFDLLLEGFALYAKTDPKALLIIGAGMHPKFEHDSSYRRDYKAKQAKAATLLSPQHYQWLGFIKESDIAAYYSASDVSLYPYTISMSSSGPMSFAMGYERAFLASDVFRAVLPNEVIFERTAAAMANKLRDFFAHQQKYTAVSRQLKQQRLWSTVGARTYALYQGGVI